MDGLVTRTIFQQILPWLGEKKVIIIKGGRQTGKTTLLRQIQAHLEKNGKKCVYLAVDQELDNPIFSEPRLFIKFLQDQYNLGQNFLHIFLDECQYLKKTGLFLKNIFDSHQKHLQLIVSGSSSLEITKRSAEFLTGRKIDFQLRQFSFKEFLSSKSARTYAQVFSFKDFSKLRDFYQIYKKDLEQYFLEFINWGGYPEVAITADQNKKSAILKEIVRTYLEKDVALFFRIENISGFNNLTKILASQVGNLLNREELTATLALNKETIKKYLDLLEGTFVFSLVKPFFTNRRKELTKMPKVFAEDLGTIRAVLNTPLLIDYSLISGSLVENFVFNELAKNNFQSELFFYRTVAKSEIDFILKREGLLPIEVKFRKNIQKIPLAVRNFIDSYPREVEMSLVLTQDDLKKENGVLFLPVVLLPFITFQDK